MSELLARDLSRSEHLKRERNRQRFFAGELVDALRGRHPTARVVPVVTSDIEEFERPLKDGKVKFRVVGAHRGSKWSRADYAALVFSPNWADADGTSYRITLPEPDFENVRARLTAIDLACGAEHFSMSGRTPQAPGTKACDFCEMLYSRAALYRVEGDEWVRNRDSARREWVDIAEDLLGVSKVAKVLFSNN